MIVYIATKTRGMFEMEMMYWKAVIRYGHVGRRNEVSVARHLKFPEGTLIYEVIKEIYSMPGTKNNCIQSVYEVTEEEFLRGVESEKDNFYLQNLFQSGA